MNTRTEGILRRPVGRLLIFVLAALLLAPVCAKAEPVKTMVQDTLYRANGQVAQGRMTVRWNSFSTSAGEAVPAGELTATIGANGSIAIPLIPNSGSTPSGTYYKVIFKLSDGTTSEEQWVVPVAATTTVAEIRAKVVPQAVAAQFVTREYLDAALEGVGAVVPASVVHLTGAETITGAKSFTVSPEVPATPADAGSAVAKAYVDGQVAGLAQVARSGDYNDLVNKPTSGAANLTSPGPIGSATPSTINATSYSVSGVPISSANLSDGSAIARTNQANTFTQRQTMPDLLTKNTPMADIRAYGAVADNATDIGPALAAATAAACTSGGVVYLPCGGNGCYLADGVNWASGSSCGGQGIQYKLQGSLKSTKTTLVLPNASSLICDGGAVAGGFTPRGPNCDVQGPSAHGTLGSAVSGNGTFSFTPTFTTGSMANLVADAAISVIDPLNCAITGTITRTSATQVNVTATVATPCRIPPGSLVTLSGATDTSFNGSFPIISIDYASGAVSWTQTGASAATTTGGTIAGYNDDSFETVRLESCSGSSCSATFAQAHLSSAVWGEVGVAMQHDTYLAHHLQGVNIAGAYGAGLWGEHIVDALLDGVSIGSQAWPSSIPAEFASSYNWKITNSYFVTTFQYQCPWNCSQTSYPLGLRVTSRIGYSDPSDLHNEVSFSTVLGGVKIDTNGNNSNALLNKVGDIHFLNMLIEQPVGYGILVDPRYASSTSRHFTISNLTLQDNFLGFSQCLLGYTDPAGYGSAIFNTANATLSSGCLTNANYQGALVVNGVDYTQGSLDLPRKGTINDGITTETELRSIGADMHPSLVLHATEAVTTNPASWSCGAGCTVTTGIKAPDGTATAGELVSASTGNNGAQVWFGSYNLNAGDWIFSGVWCMPGTGSARSCQSASMFDAYQIYSFNSAVRFDGGSTNFISPGMAFQSLWTRDWWHPIVMANKVTTGGSGSGIRMQLYSPSTVGTGTRYWMPFFFVVPHTEKPSEMTDAQWDAEMMRWRQQLYHGAVPPSMPAGALGMNPALKLYWGSDTNLYRESAGTLKTDGNFNLGAGKVYKINGTQIGTGNLGDWDNTGVADGNVPKWDAASSKWKPGTVSGGGSGTVTDFSAGDLAPLFTTTETNTTTTPALTFNLSNAAADTMLGNFTSSSAAPIYKHISQCNSVTQALNYTPGVGLTCNGSVYAAGLSGLASANSIYAGPTSGGNASPGFRAMVVADLPSAAQNSVLAGPASGGAGAPSYQTAPTISAANMTNFPTLNQSTSGNAATATALVANGTNCPGGQAAAGVDASGNAEGCFTPSSGSGTVNSGTSGQLAYYAANGTAVSGTNALPNGTTATTQTTGDATTKVATTAYVQSSLGAVVALPDKGIARTYQTLAAKLNSDITAVNKTTFTDGKTMLMAGPYYGAYQYSADLQYAWENNPSAVTDTEVVQILDKFVAAKDGSGNFPIAIKQDSTAYAYKSGCAPSAPRVESDAPVHLVHLEYLHYLRSGNSTTHFSANAATYKTALQNTLRDGTTHLVNVVSGSEYATYAFEDGVASNGNVSMGSALQLQADIEMYTMYTAIGDSANATTFQTDANQIIASLTSSSALWHSATGQFYAATGANHQDSVTASSFLFWLDSQWPSWNILDSTQRTAISNNFATNYSSLVNAHGFVRQSPSNWGQTFASGCGYGTGRYDDAYWSHGNKWFAKALELQGSPYTKTNQLIQDFLNGPSPTAEWEGTDALGAQNNLESPSWLLGYAWPSAQYFVAGERPGVDYPDYQARFQTRPYFVGQEIPGGSVADGLISANVNQILVTPIELPKSFLPAAQFSIYVSNNPGKVCFGLYDPLTYALLWQSGAITGTGMKNLPMNMPLYAGDYMFAQGASDTLARTYTISENSIIASYFNHNQWNGNGSAWPRQGSPAVGAGGFAGATCSMPSALTQITSPGQVNPAMGMFDAATSR